jgi:hypothetical protein
LQSSRRNRPNERCTSNYLLQHKKNKFTGNADIWAFVEEESQAVHNTSTGKIFEMKGRNHKYTSAAAYNKLDSNATIHGTKLHLHCRKPNCFTFKDEYKYFEFFNKNGVASRQTYEFCSSVVASNIAKALSYLIKINGGSTLSDFLDEK